MDSTFVKYLTIFDYLPSIKQGQLSKQILDELYNGTLERQFAESWAIGKVRGLLESKFDLDFELTPTLCYNPLITYNAHDRVIIDFTEFSLGKRYVSKDCILKDDIGYICLTDHKADEFDESLWQRIGNKYDLYYIAYPYPLFSQELKQKKGAYIAGLYEIGDKVWWNGHIYSALRETLGISHEEVIQFNTYSDIPQGNIFPDDKFIGKTYWKDEGLYEIDYPTIPNTPTTDGQTPIWIFGDNRDPVLVQAIVDLALYMLHKRIVPNNIPESRERSKNSTFEWLRDVKSSGQTAKIEELQPRQGDSFAWGSKPRNINGY